MKVVIRKKYITAVKISIHDKYKDILQIIEMPASLPSLAGVAADPGQDRASFCQLRQHQQSLLTALCDQTIQLK